MMLRKGVFAAVMSAVLLVTGFSGVQAVQAAPGAGIEKGAVVSVSGTARDTMVSISGMTSAEGIRICMVDTEDHSVWMREKKNVYTLFAGVPGNAGYADGALTQAQFDSPWTVIAYKGGYLISDTGNHVIRQIQDGQVTTFAGTAGKPGAVDKKAAKQVSFNRPTGMALGDDGTVYVADTGNHTIRAIDSKGNVTTLAGAAGKPGTKVGSCAASRFREPTGLFYDKGVLYVADSGNHRICSIANGKVKVVAGSASGEEGDASGKALQAALSNPQQIVAYQGVLYIADTGNGCLKRLKGGKLKTILAANSRREGRIPAQPRALMVRNSYLFFGDAFNGDVCRMKL